MQTKLQSAIESSLNIIIGYFVAIAAQMVIFPVFDIIIQTHEHLLIGVFFTVVSFVRSYCLRRLFNRIHNK